MNTLKRDEDRKIPQEVVSSKQRTTGGYDGYSIKSTTVKRQVTKKVAIPIKETVKENRPASSPVDYDPSAFESDDEETKAYRRRILQADSATRAESNRISDEAKKEIVRSCKAVIKAENTQELQRDYLDQMKKECDRLQENVVSEVSKVLGAPVPQEQSIVDYFTK